MSQGQPPMVFRQRSSDVVPHDAQYDIRGLGPQSWLLLARGMPLPAGLGFTGTGITRAAGCPDRLILSHLEILHQSVNKHN